MAETPADVKRDIEMTRERISSTLQQLEAKTNVMQIVKDNPWPAVGVAFAAGFLLSGSRADVKAASATLVATRGTGSRLGTVLDDVVANLMGGLSLAFQQRVDSLVDELKGALVPAEGGNKSGGASAGSSGARSLSQGASGSSASGTGRFAESDVTSSATRGDSVAAAGTTGASEARSALGGASSGGTAGSTGMGAIGNATQSGGTLSSAGSQGGTTGSDWSPQGAKLEGNSRAD